MFVPPCCLCGDSKNKNTARTAVLLHANETSLVFNAGSPLRVVPAFYFNGTMILPGTMAP